MIDHINNVLVEYFTKLTDYIADEKIYVKNITVIQEFLEPFKWDKMWNFKSKLGPASELITAVFKSKDFWYSLKNSHSILKKKYPCSDPVYEDLND